MKTNNRNVLSVALMVALSAAIAPSVNAQSNDETANKADQAKKETDAKVLDTVTVTATKFETTLMQTPLAVSA